MKKQILLLVVIANMCFSPTPRSQAIASPIECTEDALRNAVALGGIVTLPEECVYTLTADLPPVDKNLTIRGNGAIIDGDYVYSIFRATESANLTLFDLTLQNGFAGSGGGAVAAEDGDITVDHSRFFDNWSNFGGGAMFASTGDITISASVFAGNQAADGCGGALYAADGRVSIESSVFRDNVAGYGGGAIFVGAEMLTVTQSVFAGNTAGYEGGAVSGYDMTISNSTFFDNTASIRDGGALFSMGQITLTSSTITGNRAYRGGGIGTNDYMLIRPIVSQSILAGNEADTENEYATNTDAPLKSEGYNLLGSEQDAKYLAETDIITDQPGFEAFSGEVVPLGLDSPALDAVPVQECATEQDQRGNARPLGAACDIGAVEMEWTPEGELITILPAESAEAVPITTQVGCSEAALTGALKVGGTLELAVGCTYTLTRNLPLVTGDITIHGHGSTIDGQNEYRILYVPGAVEVALDGVTITRVGKNFGAGLYAPQADVTITNSTFLANQVSEGHGAVQARNATITNSTFDGNSEGAVQVHEKAVVTRCTFSNNRAEYSDGGGLSASEAIVTDSVFTGNKVGSSVGTGNGGGLSGGTVTVAGSWFSSNEAVQGGGVNGSDVTIENSVLIGNTAQFGGGVDAGMLTIINSTFSGNIATQSHFSNPAAGGGASGSDVTIVNSTFSDNQSENVGGAVSTEYGNLTIQQSIIAGNQADAGRDIYVNDWTDFNSLGYNLIGDDNGGNLPIDPTDIVSSDPGLTPFYQDEGVYFLTETSAALDAVPLSDCQSATDQRGTARAQGSACDIGAVEMERTADGTLIVPSSTILEPTTTHLDCTEAALAEAISTGGMFELPQNCTITLTADLPQIEGDLTLYGNGATIDGDTTFRIFYAPIADITLSHITVQNGVDSGLTAEKGDVTLSDCTFSGNVSEKFGGGVRVDNGRATLSHCTFSDNTTGDEGGGVYVGQGRAIISYCVIFGNRVTRDFSQGGGLWVRDATIANSTIANNFAYRGGGVQAGTATIVGSTLTDNLAREGSGFRSSGRLNLAQSIISGNSSNSRYTNDIEAGEFISDNYNLIGSTAARLVQTAPNDIVSDDPRLERSPDGVLLLRPDSPAVDAIPVDECTLADDQRGVARPQGNGCDIGAVEMEQNSTFVPQIPTPTPTIPAAPQAVACSQSALSEALNRGGTIDMPADCIIMLLADLPEINRDVAINGNHSTIDGGGIYRLLHAPGQAAITLNDLTLQNGRNQLGGAVFSERGDISINRCLFTGNEAYAPTDYDFGRGGAVYAGSGQLTVIDSVFTGNIADPSRGGAIFASNGDVWISGSAFINNSARSDGGGVFISGEGSLVITNTTFSRNHAGGDGGALFVWNRPFEITHSTITENTADNEGGGVIGFGVMGTISRSILTSNTAPESPDFDIYRFASKGYNILGEGHSGSGEMTFQPTDITQQDPNLLPLADHIHLLGDDSPALDAIPINECPLSTDQRGVPRPQGSGCDIGAVEMEQGTSPAASVTPPPTPGSMIPAAPSPTPTFAVPVSAIECTEAALAAALAAGGEINLPLDCTIFLSADLPEITADVVINGSGATIDGKDTYRLFYVPNKANLTLNQITLQRGKADDGGAVYAYGGDITINNCSFIRNQAVIGNGGAVYVYGGHLDVSASTFTQNYASGAGGAVHTSYGPVTVTDSRIAQNSAGSSGGGIASSQGEVTITGSLITGNTAGGGSGSGGGLWISKASATIVNSTFSLNRAVSDGGAILADSLTLISCTITQNMSERYGGGISIRGQEFILQQSIVADNLSVNGRDISVSTKSFESRGYNLLSDNASLSQLLLPSDIVTGVYGLARLVDGFVGLLESSPARDAIPSAECATSIDQRGAVRPQGAGCDIGAVEMGDIMAPPGPAAVTPTPTAALPDTATCSLTALNEAISAGGTVDLVADCVYTLTEDLPEITTDIVIHGNGAVIDGNDTYRLLYAPGDASITVEALTLRHGAAEFGGAIFAMSGAVILNNSLITGNTARRSGGGIYVHSGPVTITASTITDNTARNHGGGIAAKTGNVQITESLIGDNTAGGRGGGLYTQGKAPRIIDSTIQGNQSTQRGGGLYAKSEEVLIEDSTVTANTVDEQLCLGGGVYAEHDLIIRRSTIEENYCDDVTGIYSKGDVIVEDSTISHHSGNGLAADGDVLVQGSTFSGNSRTALISGGKTSVVGSTFSNNGAWGIDVYNNDIDIADSHFVNNSGGVTVTSDYPHTVTIVNSVFADNTNSAVDIYSGSITATNSTFTGNTGPEGGAIQFGSEVNPLESDEVRLVNCTVSNNRATTGGGVFLSSGTLVLQQTIIAGNMAESGPDIALREAAHLESRGYNLIGENNSGQLALAPTDKIEPGAFTGDLSEGSPAIDAVPASECATPTDQRGVTRPQNQACDIGAIEMLPDEIEPAATSMPVG